MSDAPRETSRRRPMATDTAAGRKGHRVKAEMNAARARILAAEAEDEFNRTLRCTFSGWGMRCTLLDGHDGGHDPGQR